MSRAIAWLVLVALMAPPLSWCQTPSKHPPAAPPDTLRSAQARGTTVGLEELPDALGHQPKSLPATTPAVAAGAEETIVAGNLQVIGSNEFWEAWSRESIGGNAGDMRLAVAVQVDSEGRITMPPLAISPGTPGSQRPLRGSFVVRAELIREPQPDLRLVEFEKFVWAPDVDPAQVPPVVREVIAGTIEAVNADLASGQLVLGGDAVPPVAGLDARGAGTPPAARGAAPQTGMEETVAAGMEMRRVAWEIPAGEVAAGLEGITVVDQVGLEAQTVAALAGQGVHYVDFVGASVEELQAGLESLNLRENDVVIAASEMARLLTFPGRVIGLEDRGISPLGLQVAIQTMQREGVRKLAGLEMQYGPDRHTFSIGAYV